MKSEKIKFTDGSLGFQITDTNGLRDVVIQKKSNGVFVKEIYTRTPNSICNEKSLSALIMQWKIVEKLGPGLDLDDQEYYF